MKNDIWVRSANGRKAHGYFIADTKKLCFKGEEVTVEEFERAMKIVKSSKNKAIKAKASDSYNAGYEDAQKDIINDLVLSIATTCIYPFVDSEIIVNLQHRGYGYVLKFDLRKSNNLVKSFSIDYPDCLKNPNILIRSLNRMYVDVKGGEENE